MKFEATKKTPKIALIAEQAAKIPKIISAISRAIIKIDIGVHFNQVLTESQVDAL